MSRNLLLSAESLRYEIAERGYVVFEHDIPRELVDTAIESYCNFTLAHPDPLSATIDAMLPPTPLDPQKLNLDRLDRSQDIQGEWNKYRTNTESFGKPDGYTNRSYQIDVLRAIRGVELKDDQKVFYHFTPNNRAKIDRNHYVYGWGSIPPEVDRMEKAFLPLHKRATVLTREFCSLIEDSHPEISKFVTPASLRNSPLRFIGYHLIHQGQQVAKPHFDKGVLALQLAADKLGLRVAKSRDSDLMLVTYNAQEGIMTPALGMRDHIDKATPLQPSWHDACNSGIPIEGRNIPEKAQLLFGRWSLQFFCNLVTFESPDKTETHNR